MRTAEEFDRFGASQLPGHLGIVVVQADAAEFRAELSVRSAVMAPNGFLHAGSIVTLADTAAGYGFVMNLPDGATGFTTVELKSNQPTQAPVSPASRALLRRHPSHCRCGKSRFSCTLKRRLAPMPTGTSPPVFRHWFSGIAVIQPCLTAVFAFAADARSARLH